MTDLVEKIARRLAMLRGSVDWRKYDLDAARIIEIVQTHDRNRAHLAEPQEPYNPADRLASLVMDP